MTARKRVLIVEPDVAAREATLSFLTSRGHEVLAVADESGAIEAAAFFNPAVVVVDPAVSRYPRSFVEVLRQTIRQRALIIATSRMPVHPAWSVTIDLSLQKPFPILDLSNRIESWFLVSAA